MTKIIPAILTNEVTILHKRLNLIKSLSDWVQIDIMDGQFVGNTSTGIKDVFNLKLPFNLEAHLMVFEPQKYFVDCKKADIKRVVFHFEAVKNPAAVLEAMEEFNFQKAIALNPKTPVAEIAPFIEKTEAILLLSVEPGFSAQKFIPQTLDKVAQIKQIDPDKVVGIDGGINKSNILAAANSGADYLVIGSAIFQSADAKQTYRELKELVQN